MILTFSKNEFKERILSGEKIHTIREDATGRWKIGMTIHFWKGNPRNVNIQPHLFAMGEVGNIQEIYIDAKRDLVILSAFKVPLNPKDRDYIAKKDGFNDWQEMKTFFLDKEPKTYKLIFFKNVKDVHQQLEMF